MRFTIAYTLMFAYVIASIVFWGYSLNKQNKLIYTLEKEKIELIQKTDNHIIIDKELEAIRQRKIRRTKQYMGEGSTFILITLLTAGIVYYAYYRQRSLAKLQQNFMLSVTHELKTPIAGIKLNLQTLEKRKLDEETQKKLMSSSITETNRLNDLCNNILVSTQLESTKKAIYNEDVEMKGLILDVIGQIQQRYPTCMVTSHLMKDDFYIKGDSSLWKLVVSNLVENARKYSSGPIEVVLEKQNRKVVLAVKDQGVGIPDNEKEKIFDKFYRVPTGNVHDVKGFGLGLNYVKIMMKNLKGNVDVESELGKGSKFTLTFPSI